MAENLNQKTGMTKEGVRGKMPDALIKKKSIHDQLVPSLTVTREELRIPNTLPYTVKPEITHTFGGHKKVWVITGYGFSQVYFHMFYKSWWMQNGMGYYRLWVITVWVISGLTVAFSTTCNQV